MVGATFVAVTYNNCGQRGFDVSEANTSVVKLQDDLAKLYGGTIDPLQCERSANYLCHHRIFSAQVTDNNSDVVLPCVQTADGHEICPRGKQYDYNSSAASEPMETEEYLCYLTLPNMNGTYPIQASEADETSAINEVYKICASYSKEQK
jgi:hypothetical protein